MNDFYYTEDSLASYKCRPVNIAGCLVMLCVQGAARIVTGINCVDLQTNSTAIFFKGSSIELQWASNDFKVRTWGFSGYVYKEIIPIVPPSLEHYLLNIPAYVHEPDSKGLRFAEVSMDMACLLSEEMNLPTSLWRVKNFASNYLLYLFDYISPFLTSIENAKCVQEQIYRSFVTDIYNHCDKEHHLDFYASRLNITTRYLSKIVKIYSGGFSPKQLIDRQIVFGIKALLLSNELTVTQIADHLNFPDQSYLSRFFKRHTGTYPTIYRRQAMRSGE